VDLFTLSCFIFKKKCKKIIISPKNKCVKKSLNHPKKIIVWAPHTPKYLGAVVLAHSDRALSLQKNAHICIYTYAYAYISARIHIYDTAQTR